MVIKNSLFFLLSSWSVVLMAQSKPHSIDTLNSMAYVKSIVQFLASDSLYGRPSGSLYERQAGAYIYQKFKAIKGCKPKIHSFQFEAPTTVENKSSQNIYYYLNNHADSTILIGAHYDHIGMGEGLSLAYAKKNEIHNGADDNASGVALMLLLSTLSKKNLSKSFNYVFVSFGAHELGLYGSSAFYDFIVHKVKPIHLAINFDMIGRMDVSNPILRVNVTSTAKTIYFENFKGILQINKNYDDKVYDTDCSVFAEHGIPSLSFTTGIHNDYHKPSDDEKKINYQGIILLNEIILAYLNR